MQWANAFAFASFCFAVAIAIIGYCRYDYLNQKSYRDSLIRLGELDANDNETS